MAKTNAFLKKLGWIEVITGPMFAGKTAELIRRLERLKYAEVPYLVFKPKIDTRSAQTICSRNGTSLPSIELEEPTQILDYLMTEELQEFPKAIGIDEAQFFSDGLVEVCNLLAENGYVVIVSGLDLDFKGQAFGPIPKLLVHAESITKLTAICSECGSEATRSLRKIDGKVARYDDDLIKIGCNECYSSVCRHHHKVPNRPYINQNSNEFIKFCKSRKKL